MKGRSPPSTTQRHQQRDGASSYRAHIASPSKTFDNDVSHDRIAATTANMFYTTSNSVQGSGRLFAVQSA